MPTTIDTSKFLQAFKGKMPTDPNGRWSIVEIDSESKVLGGVDGPYLTLEDALDRPSGSENSAIAYQDGRQDIIVAVWNTFGWVPPIAPGTQLASASIKLHLYATPDFPLLNTAEVLELSRACYKGRFVRGNVGDPIKISPRQLQLLLLEWAANHPRE